jgi:hypothetical protein
MVRKQSSDLAIRQRPALEWNDVGIVHQRLPTSAQVAVTVATKQTVRTNASLDLHRFQNRRVGAGRGARTLKSLRTADFKSAAYANFATPARL